MNYAILISGRGSNMQALLDAGLPGRAAVVIADRPGAAGLGIARQRGVPTAVVDRKAFADGYTARASAPADDEAPARTAWYRLLHTLRDFRRQALHAACLGIVHPASGADLEWRAELPADFAKLLDALRNPAP